MLEFEFSSHGAGMIHAYRWEPEGQPRGVVQIIHGIAEYVPRYAGFAAFLNARGFLVTGEDHMGHGKSHGKEPCHFSGGWCAAVDDSMELLRRGLAACPGACGGPCPVRAGKAAPRRDRPQQAAGKSDVRRV